MQHESVKELQEGIKTNEISDALIFDEKGIRSTDGTIKWDFLLLHMTTDVGDTIMLKDLRNLVITHAGRLYSVIEGRKIG